MRASTFEEAVMDEAAKAVYRRQIERAYQLSIFKLWLVRVRAPVAVDGDAGCGMQDAGGEK